MCVINLVEGGGYLFCRATANIEKIFESVVVGILPPNRDRPRLVAGYPHVFVEWIIPDCRPYPVGIIGGGIAPDGDDRSSNHVA